MRSYVMQIDSLNRINEKLTKENRRVTAKYKEASQTISTLNEEKEALSEKVELASQLDALGINMYAAKNNGKKVRKIKNAKKFVLDFTIAKNITATTGEKTIYVRITTPDGNTLTKNSGNVFAYEDREINYSIKIYRIYRRGASHNTLLGHRGVPASRQIHCTYFCRWQHDRLQQFRHKIRTYGISITQRARP